MSIISTKRVDYIKYPKIYKETYWASAGFDPIKELYHLDDFIKTGKNRDTFSETHNIKKSISHSKFINYLYQNYQRTLWVYDHMEWYETQDKKIILVISPYSEHDDFLLQNTVFGVPFIKTDDLYGYGAHSYYKKFDKSISLSKNYTKNWVSRIF